MLAAGFSGTLGGMATRVGEHWRQRLGRSRLIVFFAVTSVVSQAAVSLPLRPIIGTFFELQVTASTAEAYRATFAGWQAAGHLDAYRQHLWIDALHWVWYTGLLTTLLCRLFEANDIGRRWNGLLVLPLVAGLSDCLENAMQFVFLSGADFSNIVDPLPLVSMLASMAKWAAAGCCVLLSAALCVRWVVRRR